MRLQNTMSPTIKFNCKSLSSIDMTEVKSIVKAKSHIQKSYLLFSRLFCMSHLLNKKIMYY